MFINSTAAGGRGKTRQDRPHVSQISQLSDICCLMCNMFILIQPQTQESGGTAQQDRPHVSQMSQLSDICRLIDDVWNDKRQANKNGTPNLKHWWNKLNSLKNNSGFNTPQVRIVKISV